jgi:hypothetical protein
LTGCGGAVQLTRSLSPSMRTDARGASGTLAGGATSPTVIVSRSLP